MKITIFNTGCIKRRVTLTMTGIQIVNGPSLSRCQILLYLAMAHGLGC